VKKYFTDQNEQKTLNKKNPKKTNFKAEFGLVNIVIAKKSYIFKIFGASSVIKCRILELH
jgi:hypothetical protein